MRISMYIYVYICKYSVSACVDVFLSLNGSTKNCGAIALPTINKSDFKNK